MTVLYDLVDVVRSFRVGSREVRAVDGVTMTIDAGEFVAIEGPSGSGKSTMLQLLGGLDRPSSGRLTFADADLGALGESDRTRVRREAIGFVFQHFNLIPTLTAVENVEAAMAPIRATRATRVERSHALLDQVGLAGRAGQLPSRLSAGEQQRVGIARALANSPRVVLADEPTGDLDSRTSVEVVDLLGALVEDHGVTVIMVTHADDVARRATRRIPMRDGKLVDLETFRPSAL